MPNCNLTKLQWNWLRVDCQNLSTGWRYARRNSLSTNFSSFLTGNLTVPGAESGHQAHQTEGSIPRTLLGRSTSVILRWHLWMWQPRNCWLRQKLLHDTHSLMSLLLIYPKWFKLIQISRIWTIFEHYCTPWYKPRVLDKSVWDGLRGIVSHPRRNLPASGHFKSSPGHQMEGSIPRTLLGTLTSLNVAIALRLTSQERNFCASPKHIHTVFASSFKKIGDI